MPKIHFEGADYETPAEMPADVHMRYDKAMRELPDRDQNGIPDLFEVSGASPYASASVPATPEAIVDSLPQLTPAQKVKAKKALNVAEKGYRWGRWIYFGFVAMVLACIAISFFGIIALIKSSGSYQLAIKTATESETVQSVLGTPIHDGILPSGSTSESGSNGSADFSIPLSGSKQSGMLLVTAVKEENTWRITTMVLEAGGQNYPIH
jgi:hypothetical protein